MSRPLPDQQTSGQGLEQARQTASRPEAPARDLCAGALRVDTYRHEVWFDERRVHVTPTEFAILAHLAATPEQVVGYGDLARHTHGEDLAWNEADARDVLRYHIRNLRRKIDRRYLASVRGAGYMLDPQGTASPPTGSGDGD
jgi:two-component system response regulator QseB